MEENQDVVPDSTTNHIEKESHAFNCGDDVLVPNKDGRYYLGTIVQVGADGDSRVCEAGTGQAGCLIKFGDGTHSWAATATLKPLSAEDGMVMCVVCKRRESPSTLVSCDMCGRGYHARCHTPPVMSWIDGASWHCRRCVDQRFRVAAAENRAMKRAEIARGKGTVRKNAYLQNCDNASSTSSCTSDVQAANESNCYCGKKSDWLVQMLMCCRCSRWFHQRCITSLQYPLYTGDKLYIFVCSNCNDNNEYLRRLELRWLDVAHLALYSLTAYSTRNYFDLDGVIMPYLMDNWHALQLPEKMSALSPAERREHVLIALTGCRSRFKCGREMKKRANIWGLRHRRPPPPPSSLETVAQSDEILTDEVVRRLEPKLRFLPRESPKNIKNGDSSYKDSKQRMMVPADVTWLNLMTGRRFHQSASNSDNDSVSSSPPPDLAKTLSMVNFDVEDETQKANPDSNGDFDEYDLNNATQKQKQMVKLYSMDYQNGGFVKKAIPFTNISSNLNTKKSSTKKLNKLKLDENKKEKVPKLEQNELRCKENDSETSFPHDNMRESSSPDPEIIINHDKTDISLMCQNELNKPTVIDQSKKAKQINTPRNSNDSHCPMYDEINKSKCEESSDITSISSYSSRIARMNLEVSKLSTRNIIEHTKIMSLHHHRSMDSHIHVLEPESSGDETSSRGTLDAIIPPLKDFQGKNNPFLMQNRYIKNGKVNSRLSLPTNHVTAPVRPLKRQLSEKDIIIGPNGEVKRRKFRRPKKTQVPRSASLPGDDRGSSLNKETDGDSRKLRRREPKNYDESTRRSTVSAVESLQLSPQKSAPPAPLSQLKSSMQSLFGAASRARAGEKFIIDAKRVTEVGDVQYLVQWQNT